METSVLLDGSCRAWMRRDFFFFDSLSGCNSVQCKQPRGIQKFQLLDRCGAGVFYPKGPST